jgi:YVTN family beta-propeller protein
MKSFHRSITAVLALGCVSAATAAEQPSLAWPAAATVEIAQSAGKFDFLRVDAKRDRLLAAHEKDGTSDFIDLNKHALIARVKVGAAVDTAVDLDSKFYYVSVQEGERVVVLDAATLKEVRSIKMPGPTDAIIFEPKNSRVYVTHDDGPDVWVIDPQTAKIIATIAIPGVPEFMVYDASADRIYLNIKDKDVVAVIDPAANKVIAQWPTAPATVPHGLALDGANHRRAPTASWSRSTPRAAPPPPRSTSRPRWTRSPSMPAADCSIALAPTGCRWCAPAAGSCSSWGTWQPPRPRATSL